MSHTGPVKGRGPGIHSSGVFYVPGLVAGGRSDSHSGRSRSTILASHSSWADSQTLWGDSE